jgi:hypothetical protein
MKRSKLLKVISIIIIVFGVLGILGNIMMLFLLDNMNTMMMEMGMPLYSAPQLLFGLIGTVVAIAAGIIGIAYKSKISVLIAGCFYLLFTVGEITFSILLGGAFSMLFLVGLIFPLLYMWGVYLSE